MAFTDPIYMVWFLIEEKLENPLVIHTSHVPLVCVPCEPCASAHFWGTREKRTAAQCQIPFFSAGETCFFSEVADWLIYHVDIDGQFDSTYGKIWYILMVDLIPPTGEYG